MGGLYLLYDEKGVKTVLFEANTETTRISRLIAKAGNGLTELQFLAKQIALWKASPQRKEQLTGELYYNNEHDILKRKRTIIGQKGQIETVENLPNNRLIDNQYAKMVDQKANYLFGKPFTVESENADYVERLKKLFDHRFQRTFRRMGEDCLNGAVGWLCFYYDEQGQPIFKRLPPFEILPFWADDDHTQLDCAIRLYPQEVWEGPTKKTVDRVELYKPDGIWRYIYQNGTLTPDAELGEHTPYFWKMDEAGTPAEGFNWLKIPLIPFKYNSAEIPLIRRTKCLQDGINIMLSDFENGMQEDPRNTILVLKDYDGTDLGEFRQNLAAFGVIKVRADGDVQTLEIAVDAENYKAILDALKKALIENARGYDAKDERMGNNPNQMNIQSMYSDIDLDANGMETEFQASLEELLWFIDQYFIQTNAGDFTNDQVVFTFNRDILINESEAIANCGKSVGILSEETIIGQHPWTNDVTKELERVKAEREAQALEADPYAGA
ncbi:MAG: phage portal protein, partial [Acinetobacter sp.]